MGELARLARERLQTCSRNAVRRVSCEEHHDQLVLRGQVLSFYEKQLAQELVRETARGRRIVNEIEVEHQSC